MSNFQFLHEWQTLQQHSQQAERLIFSDPRASSFYSRYSLEQLVHWMYDYDSSLKAPSYDSSLNTLINQPDFKRTVGTRVFQKIKVVQRAGNNAVHSASAIAEGHALQSVKELHHIFYWFYRTYTKDSDASNHVFNTQLIPAASDNNAKASTLKQLKTQAKTLAKEDEAQQKALAKARKQNQTLRQQLSDIRQQLSEQKALNAKRRINERDPHDFNEDETRRFIIDQYLQEAGWNVNDANVQEFNVVGMPISQRNPNGNGRADYVLWSDDGKPLAVVEAKRTTVEVERGQQQAKLYADCLQTMYSLSNQQRPLIYYTNGYDIYLWDDSSYTPRAVQGFLTRKEMQRIINRRQKQNGLLAEPVDRSIAGSGRPYQLQAIQAVCEKFQNDRERKALLVMATGTGKTRTTIALVDKLSRAGWVKNVLFLADRNALVSQAKKEFTKLLQNTSCEILTSATANTQSRVMLSTYPTMMNLLNTPPDSRLFGVGHFDLVVVDEAHRSVYRKYRYIFDYFDGLLVGLTATPKSDLDKNTYGVFDLATNTPTYAYELPEAIKDKFLVPPKDVRVALGFVRNGVKYAELSDEDKEQWESKEQLEDKEEVLPSEVNAFLFNEQTVDNALEALMRNGIKVAGGDRLAKTIIFAANNPHAQFIVERFNAHYRQYKGHFARVITYKEAYAESLIEEFKGERKPSHPQIPLTIAVSVDMLDTGIDVPEVANLMFFKVVKSKVKFMQMLGRGTRLSPNLFGPAPASYQAENGKFGPTDKTFFKVFDCCANFEYFDMEPDGAKDSAGVSLSESLFTTRLQLSQVLGMVEDADEFTTEYCDYVRGMLHHRVAGMNVDNFVVRPKRRVVEAYQQREAWQQFDTEQLAEIQTHLAELPTEADPFNDIEQDDEAAMRFDKLLLTMQLAVLKEGGVSDNQRDRVCKIAEELLSKVSIPQVAAHEEWLNYVISANFWIDVTVQYLELTRRKLRLLLGPYLSKESRGVVYTNFDDSLLSVQENPSIYGLTHSDALGIYRCKVEAYVMQHEDNITIARIKRNQPITQFDLDELDKQLFAASGYTDMQTYQDKVLAGQSLGLFIRSLVGFDRAAAQAIFADFLSDTNLNSRQMKFVERIIGFLTSEGVMAPEQLWESEFIDIHEDGVESLFGDEKAQEIKQRIEQLNDIAVGE